MMDAADLELFEQSLRHATEAVSGAALDAALVDLGWHDALAVDPQAAVASLFELQGRAGVTSSALGHVVAHALGVDEPTAVVLPALGTWAPPGRSVDATSVVDGIGLGLGLGVGVGVGLGVGIGGSGLGEREQVLVAWTSGEDDTLISRLDGRSLAVESIGGIDPDLGLVRVTGEVSSGGGGPGDWSAAVDLARLALAHELTGASRTMLELARTHALERVQFGQPIAGFQAVRHRLAEALVAIEGADALLDAAWIEGTPDAAAMAKAYAGRAARTVAKHSQQVLAGIGFTTEHPFHTSLRRVLVLDELFGSARRLTTSLGADVLDDRRLPPLLPL